MPRASVRNQDLRENPINCQRAIPDQKIEIPGFSSVSESHDILGNHKHEGKPMIIMLREIAPISQSQKPRFKVHRGNSSHISVPETTTVQTP